MAKIMRAIQCIYSGRFVKITLDVRSKTKRKKDGTINQDSEPLVLHKTSISSGNNYLVFEPNVALKFQTPSDINKFVYVPISFVRSAISAMREVYEHLTDKDLFIQKETLSLNAKLSSSFTLSIPTGHGEFYVGPAVVSVPTMNELPPDFVPGIAIGSDKISVCSIPHREALNMIETLDGTDFPAILSSIAVLSELDGIQTVLDTILEQNTLILTKLSDNNPNNQSSPGLKWKYMDPEDFS